MKKNRTSAEPCHEENEGQRAVTVQMPLPTLFALQQMREEFFELCLRSGEQVLQAMMEEDRVELCGEKWERKANRKARRTGTTRSEVTFAGRRVALRRLRARDEQGEVSLPSYQWAASRDPLDEGTLRAIISGVSTRRYAKTLEPLSAARPERSTSRSSVSRRFVALSRKRLAEQMSRPLSELDLWVVMVDGIVFRDHTVLVALGVDSQGNKHVLGIREGSTENSTVARALLTDLIDRGLSADRPVLFVIDGSRALRKAIRQSFGARAIVQRCQEHKRRNVQGHLPEDMHSSVRHALNDAYSTKSVDSARRQLKRLAARLEDKHPGAAASLRDGLDETLTLQRLGLHEGSLWKTLRTTNPIENLNGTIATVTRNVRRWRGGAMLLRWVSTAVLHAESRFRRVRGYKQMPLLIRALQRLAGTDAPAKEMIA